MAQACQTSQFQKTLRLQKEMHFTNKRLVISPNILVDEKSKKNQGVLDQSLFRQAQAKANHLSMAPSLQASQPVILSDLTACSLFRHHERHLPQKFSLQESKSS